MKIDLPPEMANLLREVAKKHQVNVQPFAAPDGSWQLTDTDREILIDIISREFCAKGLGSDSEPNQRGFQLEELLDRLNRHRS